MGIKSNQDIRSLIREIVTEVIVQSSKEVKASRGKISKSTTKNDKLESLIGTIPFILLNKSIFQKNQDIADFAFKIGVDIPQAHKKKIDDLIGRVITSIAEFSPTKIKKLNQAILELKKSNRETTNKETFFEEWDKAISNMKL